MPASPNTLRLTQEQRQSNILRYETAKASGSSPGVRGSPRCSGATVPS